VLRELEPAEDADKIVQAERKTFALMQFAHLPQMENFLLGFEQLHGDP